MTVEVGNPARFVAWARWGMCNVLSGHGPGRHPFRDRGFAASMYCLLCGRQRSDRIHSRPKRRKCAAFDKSATLFTPVGPGNPTPSGGTPVAP